MNLTSARILVVDDNTDIHEDFKKILTPVAKAGGDLSAMEDVLFGTPVVSAASSPSVRYVIDCASQGAEGLEKVRAAHREGDPYSLAFIDVRMPPGWSGVETVKRIWAEYPDIQVVLCTAYSDYSWAEIIRELDPGDRLLILRKPFDSIEVLQFANALTQKWEATRVASAHVQHLDHLVRSRTQHLEKLNKDLVQQIAATGAAETATREAEERFSLAFHTIPLAMAIVSLPDGRWLECNAATAGVLGCTPEALLSGSVNLRQHLGDEPFARLMQATSDKHTEDSALECSIHMPGEETRLLLIRHEAFQHKNEVRKLLIMEDVTRLRKSESDRRQSQKMEAVGRLAAGIAHDFNNILTVIQGQTSLLMDEPLSPPAASSVMEIGDASRKAGDLVRQLLAFGRKQVIRSRTVSLNEVISKQCSVLHRIIGEHITLTTECDPADPILNCDPLSIEQILMNLVVNARDAIQGHGGSIHVKTTHGIALDDSGTALPWVGFTVADNGGGMDESTRKKAFDPFFTTKAEGAGTGLGLATVYGLVQQLGGTIELHSELHKGTIFHIRLPAQLLPGEQAPIPQLRTTPGHAHSTYAGLRAMIVEDEDSIRKLLKSLLQKKGITVTDARDATDALEVWEANRGEIDLIITDVVMPGGMSGLSMGKIMMSEDPDVKVVYSSGYSSETLTDEAFLCQENNYLPKPYDAASLSALLEKLFPAGGRTRSAQPHAGERAVLSPA